VISIDFNETANQPTNAQCLDQPPTGTNAPVNPLGNIYGFTPCDDYALISNLNLSSVFLPANSPFGNTVDAWIDFRLNAGLAGSTGALVCTGIAGQQPERCGIWRATGRSPLRLHPHLDNPRVH
jgi:hypothetical protein